MRRAGAAGIFSFAFQQRAHTTHEGVLGRRLVGGWEGSGASRSGDALAFRESLHPELVLLDVEGRRGNTVFEPLARAIVEHLVADRQMAGEHAGAALQLLTQHLDSAKRVEHDDDVLQTAQARQEKKDSRKKLASNLSLPNLFRATTQQEEEKEEPSRPASPA